MKQLKLCPKCNHPTRFDEIHKLGCAACSILWIEDYSDIIMSEAEFEALPDYVDPDIEANKGPAMSEINSFDREER